MTTITNKLAEALELAREWFRHEDPNIGPQAFEVVEAADAALAAYASKQAEPSSGSDAAAPVVAGPSDARVEAAAMALARMSYGHQALDSDAAEWREHARAVLKAADAVSAVPDGFVLVREKATPLIREALRIGMRREVPNDELCDIRWRAAIAAASPK